MSNSQTGSQEFKTIPGDFNTEVEKERRVDDYGLGKRAPDRMGENK